jgi:hypothetical protein
MLELILILIIIITFVEFEAQRTHIPQLVVDPLEGGLSGEQPAVGEDNADGGVDVCQARLGQGD